MAVAMYLLSTLDETTPTWLMNVYFFLLGFSLGLIIQVLVIAVQNTAPYEDLGEALGGAPTSRTSEQEAERVVSWLPATDLRRFGYAKLARAAGLDLPGGACWILTMLARQGATPGPELARQAGVTVDEGRPNAQILVDRGLINRTDGVLEPTPPGAETANRLFAAKHDWLERQLAGWSPEQHAELEHVLTKLSREMLGEESDRRLAAR